MSITLTTDQQNALDSFQQFLCDPIETVFVLSGYSGTGKTTLVKYLLEELPNYMKVARLLAPKMFEYEVALTATTNINLIDGTPGGTEHYTVCDGLRKDAFTNSTAVDGGTLAYADFLTVSALLGENVSGDLFWLFGTGSHITALGIDEFKNQYINGSFSTVNSGRVPSFLGNDVAVDRYHRKSNTAGKVSATPANNTRGSIILADKYAMQWAYNGDYSIELLRIPAKGWQLVGYSYFGATSASAKAGTDPRVAMAYNLS